MKSILLSNHQLTGIYTITSPSGKIYVGSAVNFTRRWYEHRFLLRNQGHGNKALQAAFNKYGQDGLIYKKLLICEVKDLIFYEQRCIDILNPAYNFARIAGSCLGTRRNEATKLEMSKKRRGKKQTPEHVMDRTLKLRGKKRSDESIENYRRMRDRLVRCVETGVIFRSGKEAAIWCQEQRFTNNRSAFVIINRAIRLNTGAYGFHWNLVGTE